MAIGRGQGSGMQSLLEAVLDLIDRRFVLSAMNAQPVKIQYHLLNNLQRIGHIHHQPAVANQLLGLTPHGLGVLSPLWSSARHICSGKVQ
jgi:hypothetical protein